MRLRSVDVFRGLTMAGMVVVNNPGDWGAVYAPLRHADWHGWTPTDLVFPWFLVIMGASLTLGRADRGTWADIVRRSATIAGLGLFMSGFPYFNPARWRIPGVLMRIALCYLSAAAIWRAVHGADAREATRRLAGVAAASLLGYWGVLVLVAPPGGAAGDLAPGRGLGAWLDRAVLGGHLYRPDWDPEGLLSTWPAVASTLLGAIAGLRIRTAKPAGAAPALVGGGAALLMLGLAWGIVLPINKSLWTSSYAVFTAGSAWIVLGLLHRALDGGRASARAIRCSEPLVALGRNALLLFVLSGLVARTLLVVTVGDGAGGSQPLQAWLYRTWFAPLAPPPLASLLYAVTCLLLLYTLLAGLHRRRWYWTA
ncbi:MAG: acyltransferase family protein [Vicinamibacterales bacterium]